MGLPVVSGAVAGLDAYAVDALVTELALPITSPKPFTNR